MCVGHLPEPLLHIGAAADPLVPARSSRAAARSVSTRRSSTMVRPSLLAQLRVLLLTHLDPTGTGKALSQAVKTRSLSLVFPSSNLIDAIWRSRPPRSAAPIQPHPLKFTGESASSKLASLRKYLRETFPAGEDDKAEPAYLVTTLPAIAWLLNLRGDDIAHNPVFYAYVLVTERECVLWVQSAALATDEVRRAVGEFGGRVEEYGDALEGLKRERDDKAGKVVTDVKASWAVVDLLGEVRRRRPRLSIISLSPTDSRSLLSLPLVMQANVEIVKSPIETAQAVKNKVEIEGFRRAYLRDGAAWVRPLARLPLSLHEFVVLTYSPFCRRAGRHGSRRRSRAART